MTRVLLFLLVFLCALPANAHELKPAVLSLREVAAGRFEVAWRPPVGQREIRAPIRPVFPEHCKASARELDCGERGLEGKIGFSGLEDSVHRVIVQIEWQDGSTRAEVVDATRPEVTLAGGGSLALAYVELGVEPNATGFDHLLFVLGLLLLVGFRKRLFWTITAFTLAHSVTLAFGVLGLVSAPRGPVEAVIALSILLVAAECARGEPSLTRRYPWAVAFGFGLLHGFGFAGALAEIGLPRGQVPLALACFNVGVELGQLALIAVAIVLGKLAVRLSERAAQLEKPIVYLMGTAAAYWTIERVFSLWAPG